jgi:hypothetical protein
MKSFEEKLSTESQTIIVYLTFAIEVHQRLVFHFCLHI